MKRVVYIAGAVFCGGPAALSGTLRVFEQWQGYRIQVTADTRDLWIMFDFLAIVSSLILIPLMWMILWRTFPLVSGRGKVALTLFGLWSTLGVVCSWLYS